MKTKHGLFILGLGFFLCSPFACNQSFDFDQVAYERLVTDLEIEDEALEMAIRHTRAMLASEIQYIDASGHGIGSLQGMGDLFALVQLKLTFNDIEDLTPLEGLSAIFWIDVSENEITDLGPLSDMEFLFSLSIRENQIDDLTPLAGLPNLTHLAAGSNHITDVEPLADLTQLENLYLHENEIGDLAPLSSLTSLRDLWIANNQVDDIAPLSSLQALEYLELSTNQIDDISPLASLGNLHTLGLGDNPIADFGPLANLPNLQDLELGVCGIHDATILPVLDQLNSLDLSYNDITTELMHLAEFGSLERLVLTGNDNLAYADLQMLQDAMPQTEIEWPELWIPEVPQNIGAVAADGAVTLSWGATDSADYFEVYYSTSPGVTTADDHISSVQGTTVDVQDLQNGIPHYFAILSVRDPWGDPRRSALSEEVNATPGT